MVKGTIIEEKNCFSDDSARRFMQTIQQTSCNISTPDLSLHSSPFRPKTLCLSGFREVKSFLYLSTPLHPFIFFLIKNYLKISFSVLSARKRGMLIKESSLLRLSIEYLMRKPGEYLLLYSIKLRPVTLVPDFTSTGITSKPR